MISQNREDVFLGGGRRAGGYESSSELGRGSRSSRLGERSDRVSRNRLGGSERASDRAMLYPRRGSTRGLMDSLLSEAGGGGGMNGMGGNGEFDGGMGGMGMGMDNSDMRFLRGMDEGGRFGRMDGPGGFPMGGGGMGRHPNMHRLRTPHDSMMMDPRTAFMGNEKIYPPQSPRMGNLYTQSPMIGRRPMVSDTRSPLNPHRSPSAASSAFDLHRMDRQRNPYGPHAGMGLGMGGRPSNYRQPYVEDYESEVDAMEAAMMQQELWAMEGGMGDHGLGMYGRGYGDANLRL